MVSILPLKLDGATARKRGQVLVGPVNLSLKASGITMIIGPNGAGKTSLLRLMHGLQPCTHGTVSWAVPTAIARQSQAFVFQTPVMMRRTVLESIAFPLTLRGIGKPEAQSKALETAARFGLENLLESRATQLSGGEKQKLSLARALIVKPEVLFLDEPCASLDGRATAEIEAILQAASGQGTKVVMSTHHMGQARRLAQDVIFLLHGKVHEQGAAAGFFRSPTTPEALAFINGEIVA